MKKWFLALTLTSLAVLPALLRADNVVEEIIARVNNSIVTRAEYLRSKEQLKDEIKQDNPLDFNKAYAEKEKDVLRDLINQQLLLDKGKDLGITGDVELIKRLDEMRKQMNLQTIDELEEEAKRQGVSFEDFKQNLRNQIITQQVIGREVGAHISVSKEEEQKFYEEHKSDMQQPERIRLSEILIPIEKPQAAEKVPTPGSPAADGAPPTPVPLAPPAPAPTEEQPVAASEAKAQDVLQEIKKGTSFEDVAKKYSQGPTAAQGGDLGYFERGKLAKELEEKTFAMKAGDVSDVIRSKQGFILLKVTEHQMAGVPALKEIEPKIQDALYYQKLQPALKQYFTKLREEAFIDVKPGYVDTGASPNQTKPVETTAKDANAKKLKKKKKLGII
jgi:peptidyl-prolyl cis-trans isomerase SurA